MSDFTLTTADAILKPLLKAQRVEELWYDEFPLLSMLMKDTNFVGRPNMQIPIVHGTPQNISPDYATAKAGTSAPDADAFYLPRIREYAKCTVDVETMEVSKTNEGAFASAVKVMVDSTLKGLKAVLAQAVYGSGFGELATISGTVASGTTITLANANDVVNFEKGMKLVFAASVSASTLRDSGAEITIDGVDRDAGTLSTVEDLSTVSGLTVGDVIFRASTRQNSATPTALHMFGLGAWIPQTAPTSTAFCGVDRSVDSRLGGLRVTASGLSVRETILKAAQRAAREGGRPNKLFINPQQYADLEAECMGQVQYVDVVKNPTASIGFRGIRVNGQCGSIDIVQDTFCPEGQGWLIDLSTLKLHSVGELIRNANTPVNGDQFVPAGTSHGAELMLWSVHNLACNAPGRNVHITF